MGHFSADSLAGIVLPMGLYSGQPSSVSPFWGSLAKVDQAFWNTWRIAISLGTSLFPGARSAVPPKIMGISLPCHAPTLG